MTLQVKGYIVKGLVGVKGMDPLHPGDIIIYSNIYSDYLPGDY
jgi:hypothetical protein